MKLLLVFLIKFTIGNLLLSILHWFFTLTKIRKKKKIQRKNKASATFHIADMSQEAYSLRGDVVTSWRITSAQLCHETKLVI